MCQNVMTESMNKVKLKYQYKYVNVVNIMLDSKKDN